MGIAEILAVAASVSLLSGWRLYLAVLATGIAMRSGGKPARSAIASSPPLATSRLRPSSATHLATSVQRNALDA